MDDKKNSEENQQENPNITPEEIPEEIDINSQPEVQQDLTPQATDSSFDEPPPIYEENKNKYLFIVGGVVVFIIFFLLILKLLAGSKSAPVAVKLTYWGLWEDQEIMNPVIQEYQKNNKNITINYEKMSPQDYLQKLLARGKEGRGPDIFRFHNTWVPEVKDILAPIPPQIMSTAEFEKTFYSVAQRDLRIDQYYYGLPLEIDGLVLLINQDLFKKAGIPNFPSNWDQLLDDAGKITTKDREGKIITSGIALGTASNVSYFSDILGWMLIQNGGDLKKISQKEGTEILKSYRAFAESPNNFWDEDMPNSLNAFTQEKVAMVFAPSWEILTIKAKNPEIKIKVLPLPGVPGGKSVALSSYWVEGVSRYSKNQVEAWKFLKYLSSKETMTKLYELESKVRLFGEPYSRKDLGSLLIQNEYIGAVIQQAESYQTLPVVSNTFDDTGLNDSIIKYIGNAINATANGVAYDQALITAGNGITQVFNKYNIK